MSTLSFCMNLSIKQRNQDYSTTVIGYVTIMISYTHEYPHKERGSCQLSIHGFVLGLLKYTRGSMLIPIRTPLCNVKA